MKKPEVNREVLIYVAVLSIVIFIFWLFFFLKQVKSYKSTDSNSQSFGEIMSEFGRNISSGWQRSDQQNDQAVTSEETNQSAREAEIINEEQKNIFLKKVEERLNSSSTRDN